MANVREGAHVVGEDGQVYVRRQGEMQNAGLSPGDQGRVRQMLTIRDAARRVLRVQLDEQPAEDLTVAQKALNDAYDANLVLASERAMSRTASPFKEVASLVAYAEELLREAGKA